MVYASTGARPRDQSRLSMPLAVLMLSLGLLLFPSPAQAISFPVECITLNDPGDCAIGEAQIVIDVTPNGGRVRFDFSNLGPEASAIRGIFFDNGALLAIQKIFDSPPDVDFALDPNTGPGDLPGGNLLSPPFVVTMGFRAIALPPPPNTGVDPNESVGIRFDLMGGMIFQDVIDDLNDGSLRIGVHVLDYASEGSESFILTPEPGTLVLLSASLATLALLRRRRRRRGS